MASVIRSVLRGEPARCSHGRQIRDYMHVQDVANGLVALLDSDVRGVVNVSQARPTTLREIVLDHRTVAGTAGAHSARRDSSAGERRAAGGRATTRGCGRKSAGTQEFDLESGLAPHHRLVEDARSGRDAMSEICVLGTGMAGYGAAHRLREAGVRPVMFDKKQPLRRPHGLVPGSRASTRSTKGRTSRSPSTSGCRSSSPTASTTSTRRCTRRSTTTGRATGSSTRRR